MELVRKAKFDFFGAQWGLKYIFLTFVTRLQRIGWNIFLSGLEK